MTHFAVAPSSGVITYVGEARELSAGPRRYELTVTARDTRRLVAAATVVVTVASVDGPLDAVDDAAQTLENRPVTIDVLANDRGPGA